MAIEIGKNSYITVEQADAYFEYVIQDDVDTIWADLNQPDKERYIVSAFREIAEVDFASMDKAEREQLRVMEMLFLDYDEFMKRKHLRMAGVKKFKNKEWEESFETSDRAGDGAFGYNDSDTGNSVFSL